MEVLRRLGIKGEAIALKNLTTTPDEGEFNQTMYCAHGNLDYIEYN